MITSSAIRIVLHSSAFFLIMLGWASSASAQPLQIRKGSMPSDPNYWKYHDWYNRHAVVSVLVNGVDREELVNVLAKIEVLKEHNVLIGRIIIVGTGLLAEVESGGRVDFAKLRLSKSSAASSWKAIHNATRPTVLGVLSRRIGLTSGQRKDVTLLLKRFDLKYSPTWIVRHRGGDYIYEGTVDLMRLFDRDGTFLGSHRERSGRSEAVRAHSLNLDDPSVQIVHHVRKPSGTLLAQRVDPSENIKQALKRLPGAKLEDLKRFAVEYAGDLNELPRGAGTGDFLPTCEANDVRRVPVLADSRDLDWFDMLVYAHNDPEQIRRVDRWERPAAPYLEGDLFNPYRDGDPQQEYLRLFELRCLPTRFRFVTADGKRQLEYREGIRAWDAH